METSLRPLYATLFLYLSREMLATDYINPLSSLYVFLTILSLNKARYTAESVACDRAGAKTPRKNAEKQMRYRLPDRPINQQTDAIECRL